MQDSRAFPFALLNRSDNAKTIHQNPIAFEKEMCYDMAIPNRLFELELLRWIYATQEY